MTKDNKPKPNTNLDVTALTATTKIDSAGRVLFPAWLRKSWGVEIGERVIVKLEDGKLFLEREDGTLAFDGSIENPNY